MIVSLNEIEVNLRKAAIGVGLPIGLCEDLGRATAWLAASGLPAVSTSLAALENLLAARSAPAVFSRDDVGDWRISPARPAIMLSAIHVGPPACDLVCVPGQVGERTARILLDGVDCPLLVLAMASVHAVRPGMEVKVSLATVESVGLLAICGAGDADLFLDPEGVGTMSDMILEWNSGACLRYGAPVFTGVQLEERRRVAPTQGVRVTDADWQKILRLSAKTLVPASEQSRLQGAGAGLRDND